MGHNARPAASKWRCVVVIVSSVLLRFIIFALFGDRLQQRVELSNAFNGFKSIKEASELLRYGVSPYSGSGIRAPPLAVFVFRPVVDSGWEPWLFTTMDIVCAGLLYLTLSHLQHSGRTAIAPHTQVHLVITPFAVTCIYLCNPLTVLTCASSSLAGASQLCVIWAVYGAVVYRSPVVAALGLAVASYLDLYMIVFCLPLLALLATGAEGLMEQPCIRCLQQACTPVDVTVKLKPRECQCYTCAKTSNSTGEGETPSGADWPKMGVFIGLLSFSTIVLMLASDAVVMSWSASRCLEWLDDRSCIPAALCDSSHQDRLMAHATPGMHSIYKGLCWVENMMADYMRHPAHLYEHSIHASNFLSRQSHASWMWKSYGGLIMYDDLSPNIGVWWYFIGEMFQEFRVFFKFVLHSQVLVFSVPISIRFRARPLFACLLLSMLIAIFKPYPVAADTAFYLNLLPLFVHVLRWSQTGMMIGFIMHMAAVMGPATLYQWLHTGSANSNFFYAMTLVWAAAQVLLLLLVTFSVKQHDVDLSGKAQMFKLPDGVGKTIQHTTA